MKTPVINLNKRKVGDIELNDLVFGVELRKDILARCVNWQLAKRRAGTHRAKTRSEVSLANHKIAPQKRTGRARHGSRRVHIFRGGSAAHGPRPRSHAHGLPKKVRRLALKTALSAKLAGGELLVVDKLELKTSKTTEALKKVNNIAKSSVLFIDGAEVDTNFAKGTRNLVGVNLMPVAGANVYDILKNELLVLSRTAVESLEARLT